ncbi:MAG: hypothetical protein J0M12_01790 [Deltaproteobacteria bacterium]|nr:hypothetical protein [Deltaproteobacteria bacterium]
MKPESIVIAGYGSLSALGADAATVRAAYENGKVGVRLTAIGESPVYAAALDSIGESQVTKLLEERHEYRSLDRSALLAVLCARSALASSGWSVDGGHCGVSFGSSRGATGLFEYYHRRFLEAPSSALSPRASPTTTLGNISSWVAQDLGLSGACLSHSSTCSSAVHSLANAVAWIRAGMADRFLAGGSEAALTPFTIAQMQALGIYSRDELEGCACRPAAQSAKNTFVLGEGAACFALEKESTYRARTAVAGPLLTLESIGVAMEPLTSPTSISSEADCIEKTMREALKSAEVEQVDALILHAPGTIQGDEAELRAVRKVFSKSIPDLYSNKWVLGHTLGASGALSLELALLLLQGLEPCNPPYPNSLGRRRARPVRRVLVNSAGFGGNAASLIVALK